MVSKMAESFGYEDEDEVDAMMREPTCLSAVDTFFTADGPSKIVIAEEIVTESSKTGGRGGAETKGEEGVKILKVYDRDIPVLPSTAVFFMKNKKGKDGDDHYAIDPTKVSDGALSYGVIRAPLESLDAVIRCVYRPLLEETGVEVWGESNAEQRNEFLHSLDIFNRNLQSSIRSLSGGLELRKPDGRIEALGPAAADDSALVISSMNLLHEWCRNIESYLEEILKNVCTFQILSI